MVLMETTAFDVLPTYLRDISPWTTNVHLKSSTALLYSSCGCLGQLPVPLLPPAANLSRARGQLRGEAGALRLHLQRLGACRCPPLSWGHAQPELGHVFSLRLVHRVVPKLAHDLNKTRVMLAALSDPTITSYSDAV